MPDLNGEPIYHVRACGACNLSEQDYAACIALIMNGDAVDPESAETELRRAGTVVVARQGERIVGVGVAPGTPELGYVAVDLNHQGRHLSNRILEVLLSKNQGPLFATTSSDRMKKTLTRAGFAQKRPRVERRSGLLSLWLR